MGTTTSSPDATTDAGAILGGMNNAPPADRSRAPPPSLQPGYTPPMPTALQPQPQQSQAPWARPQLPPQPQTPPVPQQVATAAPVPRFQLGSQPGPWPQAYPNSPRYDPATAPALPGETPDETAALNRFMAHETGNRGNIINDWAAKNPELYTKEGRTCQGYWQIVNSTWADGARRAGVNLQQYPTAMTAPYPVQRQVALALYRSYGDKPWKAQPGAGEQGDRFQLASQTMVMPEQRGAQDWGHPPPMLGDPTPGAMPQQSEFGRILNAISPLLLGIGSLALRLPLSTAVSAYSAMARAQFNGQQLEYERQRTQWQDKLKESTAQQTLESEEASDAFAEYGTNNPQGLQQALASIALKYNDPRMLQMAERGDLNAIHDMQAKRDMYNQALQKVSKAAEDVQDRQAQDAAVTGMDRQWHDQFVKDHGREPTADETAIAHNENIGKAGRAGTKDPKAEGTKEDAQPYEVLDKTTNQPTRQIRLGQNGGLFDLDGKPTQLGPNEKLGNRVGAAGGAAKTPSQAVSQSHLDAADAKTRQWVADEKAAGRDPTPDQIAIHRDQELDKTLQAGRSGGAQLAPYSGPETWPGSPNTPPPGDPDITPGVWAQALLLAQKGAPVPLGRGVPEAAAIRKAYPVAQAALGIDPADAAQKEIKFAADKASEVAVSRYFGSGQAATQMRSLNTVAGHIDLFRRYAEALQTGNIQSATRVGQAMAVELGHPEVTDFRVAGTLMADEIVRLLTNTGGTRGDRDDMQHSIASYLSEGQLTGVADTAENFMHSRFEGLQQEWVHPPGITQNDRQIGERTAQFKEMMTPDAKAMFERGLRPIAGEVPTMTEQQYNDAPSGTHYRIPGDPTVRIKP